MKKIPTIFVRDMSKQPALVTPEWKAGCEWVRDGEGEATLKLDGTSCMIRDGKLYKRREVRPGQSLPPDFEVSTFDEETQKTVGWVPVGEGPDDKYHLEAFEVLGHKADGTYELVGPKIQGNKSTPAYVGHHLLAHSECDVFRDAPRTFDGLKEWLVGQHIEGLVWHHPDGRMAKIKRKDFGYRW